MERTKIITLGIMPTSKTGISKLNRSIYAKTTENRHITMSIIKISQRGILNFGKDIFNCIEKLKTSNFSQIYKTNNKLAYM
jgi:hypothetical protein